MKKLITAAVFLSLCLGFSVFAYSQAQSEESHKLIIFFSPTCHQCVEAKAKIIPGIEKEFKGRISIEYRDISGIENYKLLLGLKEKYKSKVSSALPVFYFDGEFLSGADIKGSIRRILGRSLAGPYKEEGLPIVDLMARFKDFKASGIVVAGLGDGINPCAFTVIVFFISYLALQGYRKRELVIIGLSFISSVFLTYFLIGLGIFNIVYSLEKFSLVTKVFNICVGVFSVMLGLITVYDIFKLQKTGQTEGLILQLPRAVKNRIHSIIGLHYRKPRGPEEDVVNQHSLKLIVTAFVTGFLVSFLELVCTGQLYLPTINFVLKTTPLKLQALSYLVLYNLMFIVPLFIIFIFALLGVSSEQFSRILKKNLLGIKIIMAVLFLALGVLLLWRP
ncbi:MAG: hypothetical protein PHW54_02755 [Candidatus Omnitrophica bacterium]|nr:hypothetical protein [Candidatus Omnitrophota bacterium]